jgi:hypothetical protein
MPVWFWPAFAAVIPIWLLNETMGGILGAFLGGYGFGRDWGWQQREVVEQEAEEEAEARRTPPTACDMCGARPVYAKRLPEAPFWSIRCAGCASPEMVAEAEQQEMNRPSLPPLVALIAGAGGRPSEDCHNGMPGCFCKSGWPVELQCEDCRVSDRRPERCVCEVANGEA